MKTLAGLDDVEELARRLARLHPDATRRWGRMSCPQMVCHVADAFRGPLGERPPSAPRATWFTRTLLKWVALHTPLTWPPDRVQTSPEIDQVAGRGTSPADFAADVAELVELMRRFVAQDADQRPPHAAFGRLSAREWSRWGWAHTDHHLRQFGA